MRISDKKKFVIRIVEILIIIATIILTILAISYANKVRGYEAYGGEYLIPVAGLLIVLIIEDIYQENEKKRKKVRHGKK